MKSNITLVGMPASGKSTIGVLLAKRLGYSFVDVDIVIQEKTGQLLKEIIAERGTEGFLKVEEAVNAELETERSVIAPGGSVIYGPKAMEHLHEISTVVYLKLSYEDVKQRLGDLKDRGVALKDGMTLLDLYNERVPLYEKYADVTIDETGKALGTCVDELRKIMEQTATGSVETERANSGGSQDKFKFTPAFGQPFQGKSRVGGTGGRTERSRTPGNRFAVASVKPECGAAVGDNRLDIGCFLKSG